MKRIIVIHLMLTCLLLAPMSVYSGQADVIVPGAKRIDRSQVVSRFGESVSTRLTPLKGASYSIYWLTSTKRNLKS